MELKEFKSWTSLYQANYLFNLQIIQRYLKDEGRALSGLINTPSTLVVVPGVCEFLHLIENKISAITLPKSRFY